MHKLFILILIAGCTGIPNGVTAIKDFELKKYLGTWHEIARLDHRFERGLEKISATYSLRNDGGIDVVNQGRDEVSGEWNKVEGKAYFIDRQNVGRLKVSFFGPFYGGYNIIALDKQNYSYAMIAGPDKDYLWILSRTPQLPSTTLNALIEQAKTQGFATNKLIYSRRQHQS
jgi:apolipoprotein D and lipocalin family protein